MIEPGRFQPAYYSPDAARAGNKDRWMISHMDVVTILLILFVAMAAQALQTPPVNRVPSMLQKPWVILRTVGSTQIPLRAETQDAGIATQNADRTTQNRLRAEGLDVHRDHRGIVISLPQSLLFAAGQDAVSAKSMSQIASIANYLHGVANRVSLVGYADATPIHTARFPNNWDLAAARSTRLLEVFTHTLGLDESRFVVESHGANEPITGNETAEGRAENRRVEVVILD